MTPAAAKAALLRQLVAHGETIVVRRYSGTGAARPKTDATGVRARVMDFTPQELIGTVQQGDRKVIVYADDLSAWSGGTPRKGDKIVLRGREINIEAVDDSTRRVAGTLIGYDLQVRG